MNIKSLFADTSMKKILMIKLYGTIVESDDSMINHKFSAFKLLNKLYDVYEQKDYDGILIRINSPGGAASASEEIAEAILMLKNINIPVVVSIGDICASGAYLIASVANQIFANRMSLVGSIGAIMQIPNFTDLAEKIGVSLITASSGKMKDIGNPARTMTEEEKAYLDNLVSIAASNFKETVLMNRNIINVEKMTDGRIVDAKEALENKLIDKIGTYNDALNYFKRLFNVDVLNVEEFKEKKSALKKILNLTSIDSYLKFM